MLLGVFGGVGSTRGLRDVRASALGGERSLNDSAHWHRTDERDSVVAALKADDGVVAVDFYILLNNGSNFILHRIQLRRSKVYLVMNEQDLQPLLGVLFRRLSAVQYLVEEFGHDATP